MRIVTFPEGSLNHLFGRSYGFGDLGGMPTRLVTGCAMAGILGFCFSGQVPLIVLRALHVPSAATSILDSTGRTPQGHRDCSARNSGPEFVETFRIQKLLPKISDGQPLFRFLMPSGKQT